MPVIQRSNTLAAATTDENLVQGSTFEFASTNQIVSVGVVASNGDGFVTILAGSDIVLEESEVEVKSEYPIIPDEMYYNFAMAQGDRLVIRARNANAAASNFRLIAQITQV